MDESNNRVTTTACQVNLQWAVRIPLRDGVHLNGTLYLPAGARAPGPALLMLTPYISQMFHERGMYFAANGYPFLIVDVRGRGNSEGVFRPNINEARDGYDVVEWLARQPYCNGQVAMWGGSYSGYDQWAAASQHPPHLSTIVPVASPCFSVDFPIRSNMATTYWMQWLMLVAGRASQEQIFADRRYWGQQLRRWFESGRAFKELDQMLGQPSATFQEWAAHPTQDEYWDAYNPTAEQYARLSIPVLTITGIYDGDQLGALAHYRMHMKCADPAARDRHFLIIGPWDHAGTRTPQQEFAGLRVGTASLVDLPKLHLEWYRWTMQGGERPAFLRRKVMYYVMGADRWRGADTLEEITQRVEPLYLQSETNPLDVFHSGTLAARPDAVCEPGCFIYDPADTSLAQLEADVDPYDRTDHRMVYASVGKQLVYHSAAFTSDVEISGFFSLRAWIAIDCPDTDFMAAIYEVDLSGRATHLCSDYVRARFRESLREQSLIATREPLVYEFNRFTFVARRVARGSRLRLVFGPVNSIYSQKNYNSGGVVAEETLQDRRVVTVRLYHDERHPSALSVPFGRDEDEQADSHE